MGMGKWWKGIERREKGVDTHSFIEEMEEMITG